MNFDLSLVMCERRKTSYNPSARSISAFNVCRMRCVAQHRPGACARYHCRTWIECTRRPPCLEVFQLPRKRSVAAERFLCFFPFSSWTRPGPKGTQICCFLARRSFEETQCRRRTLIVSSRVKVHVDGDVLHVNVCSTTAGVVFLALELPI
jgi:hypothetical protein